MRFCLIDFETMSACELKKAGAWRYSEDPTTSVICLGVSFDGDEALTFDGPGLGRYSGSLLAIAVNDSNCMFIAHNVGFEKAIWRNIMMSQYGWPDIPNDRWHDTQAVCAMKGLPLKLERAVMALRLPMQKDTGGTKATLALGHTNKAGYLDLAPEKLQRVYDYCKQDVRTELGLHRRVKGLGAEERKVWLLDQTINERGIKLDMEFVNAAQAVVDQATLPLLAEFEEITGLKPSQPKFKDWLWAQGVEIPNLQKETIAEWLGEQVDDESDSEDVRMESQTLLRRFNLPLDCERALYIRSILGSASIKKLGAMRACVGTDERAHGLLQYHGAGPGRWAGRLLQPQNFPRPSLKQICGWDKDGKEILEGHDPEQLVAAILSRDAEYVRCLYGEPIEAVANGLRHALVSERGFQFEVGDYATIEAIIVLTIAGQMDRVAEIAAGQKPYIPMAEMIFKRPVNKHVDLKEYTIGKHTVLGCGFQMGAAKFRSRYCPLETPEFAKAAIDAYRNDFAPKVPKLWYALEDAAVRTVWDKVPHEAYGIEYRLEDGWLTCRLHSGRKLWYYDPRPVRKEMPWSTEEKPDIRPGFEYSAWKMGQWERISAYGGLLTENVVQATARDLLVRGMFNCEAAGHPVVLTVHDEIVAEVPEGIADAKLLDRYMTDIPQWAKDLGIPVATECWTGARYRK